MKTNPQSNSAHKKNRLPLQIVLGILVLVAVVAAFFITGPTDDTVSPLPPTATALPTYFPLSAIVTQPASPVQNNQTDGVIVGALAVMLVLFVGTMAALYPSLKKR